MLVSCEVAGQQTNCSSLFTRVPTDSGMCCALNWQNTLRTSEYKTLVQSMQGSTANHTMPSQSGKKGGLRLLLDLHSNRVSFGTLNQDFDAFKVLIGEPAEFPVIKQRSVRLRPGDEHFVELAAKVGTIPTSYTFVTFFQVISSSEDIRDVAPEARQCYFEDEQELELYERYTFINCRMECAISEAQNFFKCVPWHLPKVPDLIRSQKFENTCYRQIAQKPATPGQQKTLRCK